MQNNKNVAIRRIARPQLGGLVDIASVAVDARGTLVWFNMENDLVTVGCPSSPDVTAMLVQTPEGIFQFIPLELAPAGSTVPGFPKGDIEKNSKIIFDDFFPATGGAA